MRRRLSRVTTWTKGKMGRVSGRMQLLAAPHTDRLGGDIPTSPHSKHGRLSSSPHTTIRCARALAAP